MSWIVKRQSSHMRQQIFHSTHHFRFFHPRVTTGLRAPMSSASFFYFGSGPPPSPSALAKTFFLFYLRFDIPVEIFGGWFWIGQIEFISWQKISVGWGHLSSYCHHPFEFQLSPPIWIPIVNTHLTFNHHYPFEFQLSPPIWVPIVTTHLSSNCQHPFDFHSSLPIWIPIVTTYLNSNCPYLFEFLSSPTLSNVWLTLGIWKGDDN